MTEPNASPRRWPKILAGVLLLLALVLVAAAFTLDRLLTSAARDQAALLSGRWQRPVEIGAVTTTFLTGLGVRVDGVRIGAAAGEPRPLLELDRAEVKLELLRALRSGGRDVRVRSAELKGLRVTVMRLKDGTTNVQRLADAMAGEAPAGTSGAAPKPGAEEKPADLSMAPGRARGRGRRAHRLRRRGHGRTGAVRGAARPGGERARRRSAARGHA